MSDSKHNKRMSEIGKFVLPSKGSFARHNLESLIADMKKDPKYRKVIKKTMKKATAILDAQMENGAGLPVDQHIRYFFQEYNSRNMGHGLTSMPTSFNVLEAFLKYNPKPSIFKLLKEKDHLLSFAEFIDFITSNDASEDINEALQHLEEGVIYSYNLFNNLGELTFSMKDKTEYVIGGASFIRHGSEISIFLLTGEKTDLDIKSKYLQDNLEMGAPIAGKESLKPAKGLKVEATPLLNDEDYWKVLLLTRIDFSDMTQNVRYIMKDYGTGFIIITDDISTLVDPNGEFLTPNGTELAKNMATEIENYSQLFEISKTLLHLPLYFEFNGGLITVERHSTTYAENVKNGKWRLRSNLLTPNERIAYRNVSVLRREIKCQPNSASYTAPEFKVEVSGFWRKLPIDKVGVDKYGKEIHGRTWVEKRLTWLETNNDSVVNVKYHKKTDHSHKGKNSDLNQGYIYVMRSAAHSKDIFKIGITKRSTDIRADELSNTTGSPDKFLVVQEWQVSNYDKAEKMIHTELSKYRINPKREFFQAPYNEIVKVIDKTIRYLEGGC